jgi:hypothetical protein
MVRYENNLVIVPLKPYGEGSKTILEEHHGGGGGGGGAGHMGNTHGTPHTQSPQTLQRECKRKVGQVVCVLFNGG